MLLHKLQLETRQVNTCTLQHGEQTCINADCDLQSYRIQLRKLQLVTLNDKTCDFASYELPLVKSEHVPCSMETNMQKCRL